MATNPSSGMKQSRLQCTITTHFPVHQTDTHHSYFTSGENTAIAYGRNSTEGTPSLGKGKFTTSVHELHKLWKAHTVEIRKNRSKNDNTKLDKDPPLKIGDRVLIMNYNSHSLDPKFFGDWKIWKFNSNRQVVVQN